jgi:hypothetical protein
MVFPAASSADWAVLVSIESQVSRVDRLSSLMRRLSLQSGIRLVT